MRVFVTGPTGWIGSVVVRELLDSGHQVVGLARSDKSAAAATAAGAEVVRGSLEDLDVLRAAAAAADGVIHTGYIHDFSPTGDPAAAAEVDGRAIAAFGDALAVHRRWQPDHRGAHAALGNGQRGRLRDPGVGRVHRPDLLGRDAAGRAVRQPGRDDKRLAGAGEGVPEGGDRPPVDLGGGRRVAGG